MTSSQANAKGLVIAAAGVVAELAVVLAVHVCAVLSHVSLLAFDAIFVL